MIHSRIRIRNVVFTMLSMYKFRIWPQFNRMGFAIQWGWIKYYVTWRPIKVTHIQIDFETGTIKFETQDDRR